MTMQRCSTVPAKGPIFSPDRLHSACAKAKFAGDYIEATATAAYGWPLGPRKSYSASCPILWEGEGADRQGQRKSASATGRYQGLVAAFGLGAAPLRAAPWWVGGTNWVSD